MTDAVDLDQFEGALKQQEKGIEVPLLSMDGKSPLGVSIVVAGPDSDRAAKARAELHQELIDSEQVDPLSPAEAAARGTRFLAKITLGWAPNFKLGGQELSFNEANAIRVYEKFRFIRQQVDLAAGNRSAFLAASLISSPTPSEAN